MSEVPKTSIFDDLIDPNNPPNPDQLKAALESSSSDVLKQAVTTDIAGNAVLNIAANGNPVEISMEEYAELVDLRAKDEVYQERLKQGFELASPEELTEIQLKNAAVAKDAMGVKSTDPNFVKIESVFAAMRMTMEEAMALPEEKVSQLLEMVQDESKAQEFDATYTALATRHHSEKRIFRQKMIFHKLNYGERKVDLHAGLSTEEAAAEGKGSRC